MKGYKEIVTKTVISKNKKTSKDNITLSPDVVPNNVLGCWIINHNFSGSITGDLVNIKGSYSVNVWYSHDLDHKTAVLENTYSYSDTLRVLDKGKSDISNSKEVIVRSLKQPTVSKVNIKDNKIELEVEKELGIEIIGDAKIKVPIEDDYDDYEEIIDDEKVDEIVDNIDPEYLK